MGKRKQGLPRRATNKDGNCVCCDKKADGMVVDLSQDVVAHEGCAYGKVTVRNITKGNIDE